ncbi:MAG: Rieske 2Fe-2S domain-containing protein [Acidimicrobiia bacterium]|nr:Rieske 2Fe-2S domain-containing protein [Acidimicrobiia bacterium]
MDIDEALAGMATGRFPAGIYSDPGLHELERERLFSRTWQFLAHESEVPRPGDYVVRRILDDSFIVVRDDVGKVRVLLNMCRHRGMQVCRAEAGNASHFRCPYHAWTYRSDGRLVGVPFHADAYGGDAGLDRAASGLVSAPRVDTFRGLVFASLDPGAAPLAEHLGDAAFYLDLYLHQSEAGVEVRGPQRWQVDCNWKIGAENFSGDSYHTPHTHVSVVDIGLFLEPKGHKRKEGALWWAGAGGGTTYKLPTGDLDENLAYIGYPPEMVERMRAVWSPAQCDLVGQRGFIVSASTAFPNLSLVHNWPRVQPDGHVVPFISLRLWQPLSSTRTEISSWFAVDRGAPDWFKEASYRAYVMSFGSSGMFEQDDVENWTSITSVARGRFAATVALDSTMGMAPGGGTLRPPLEDWPGPGTAHIGYGEYNQRHLLELWAAHLRDDAQHEGQAR